MNYSKIAEFLFHAAASQKNLKKLTDWVGIGHRTLPDLLKETGQLHVLNELNFSVEENGIMPITNVINIDNEEAYIQFEVRWPGSDAGKLEKVLSQRVLGKTLPQFFANQVVNDLPRLIKEYYTLSIQSNQNANRQTQKNLLHRRTRVRGKIDDILSNYEIDNPGARREDLYPQYPGLREIVHSMQD